MNVGTYFVKLIPRFRFLSHLYGSNPSLFRFNETKLTCELSMACILIPVPVQSQLASLKKEMASITFFNIDPWINRASNILGGDRKSKINRCLNSLKSREQNDVIKQEKLSQVSEDGYDVAITVWFSRELPIRAGIIKMAGNVWKWIVIGCKHLPRLVTYWRHILAKRARGYSRWLKVSDFSTVCEEFRCFFFH